MIIISPSRGNGAVSQGASAVLFDGEYKEGPATSIALFELLRNGTASGGQSTLSGPGSWTWLLEGNASDFQAYCQPKSGSVIWGSSAPINSWVSLGSDRKWLRQPSAGVGFSVLAISIREVASGTVLATCTITLRN